jgi:peptidoglycan hydrolase CwlO-like protein
MAGENGVNNPGNDEKIESLKEQLSEVMNKREEVSNEVNKLTTIALKLQGAIEVLEGMREESKTEEEE